MKILIVGGVAGGASAAARLRRLDEKAEIIMFEKGEYISFANCGLPYFIGGDIKEKEKLTLQTPESFNARFNVDVRTMNEVVSVNPAQKSVSVLNRKTGEPYTEKYDKLILSPGAAPIVPNFEGSSGDRIFTLRNIPDTYKIKDFITNNHPKSAVVVGGGYIGIEMAENLHQAGLDVTIVELLDHVIGPIDFDMACDVHNHIESKGVHLYLEDGVKSIRHNANSLDVVLNSEVIHTDMLIMAVGVKPDTTLAKDAGLTVNGRGCIVVDEHMLTSDADIYAVGDAVEVTDFMTNAKGFIPLAGPANKQGRIAADNICGIDSKYKGTQGTAILKCFDMTVACTGLNERAAKIAGVDYEKSYTYSASHASYYPGAVNMSVKLVFEKKTGKVLGAQIVGFDGVDKRCDVIATAIRANMTIQDLTELELSYAPPYSSAKDPVNMAGYVAENILSGRTKIFHWHDVASIDPETSILLDIRTTYEFDNGFIQGSINIPLDSLRHHLKELDSKKTIYVICQVGLRGHVACQILRQNGFDCTNLSGGYRLYTSVFGKKKVKNYSDDINSHGSKKSDNAVNIAQSDKIDNKRVDLHAGKTELGKTVDNTKKEGIFNEETQNFTVNRISVDATGLQCPGPIMSLSKALKEANVHDIIEISTTDPAFASDAEAFCRRTGNTFISLVSSKGISTATIEKGKKEAVDIVEASECRNKASQVVPEYNNKNIIVFSGDLDKAIASFIIANASAAMGRKVSMFFTFWGLNILRKPEKINVKKDIISKMFGMMMPRGSKKLTLSKMNMGGMGAKMIRMVMKNKNVDSLEQLILASIDNGVELVACTMSMDVMGIKEEELIEGIKLGGAAAMLANAEESDMSLFI